MAATHGVVTTFLLVLSLWSVEQVTGLNECDRGVKRHHPSQANVYQEFTRKNYRKQWIDKVCDDYTIFDPRVCACVESWDEPEKKSSSKSKPGKVVRQRQQQQQQQRRNYDNEDDDNLGEEKREEGGQFTSRFEKSTGKGRREKQSSRRVQDWQQKEQKEEEEEEKWEKERNEEDMDYRQNAKSNSDYWDDDQSNEEEVLEPNCYLHRPSTESPSHFERWTEGRWEEEDCNWPFYTGLVWSQEACRCEWGPNRTDALSQMENMVPAACLMMLRMTFDKGQIKDEGRGIWLKIRNKEEAHVEADDTAVGGFSGSFRGASVEVPYFKSNMLGSIFHIGLMFKLCPGEPDTSINIVHNHCDRSRKGTTLIVSYQAWKNQITIAMKTVETGKLVEDFCVIGATASKKSWIKLDVRYTDNYLEVKINDQLCLGSSKFYGELATNDCPLTLLGDSFCGRLDEVIVTRGCTDAHAIS